MKTSGPGKKKKNVLHSEMFVYGLQTWEQHRLWHQWVSVQGYENGEQHVWFQGSSLCSINSDFQDSCCIFALAPSAALDPFP